MPAMQRKTPIPVLDTSQDAILAELEILRHLLVEAAGTPEATGETGVVLLRLFPDLDLSRWETLCHRIDLRAWLALPFSANPLQTLVHIQETIRNLVFLSEHDPLTRLSNRGAFDRILDAECIRATRSGQALALALIDLDDFKQINDTHVWKPEADFRTDVISLDDRYPSDPEVAKLF